MAQADQSSAVVRAVSAVSEIATAEWDACANPAWRARNPFVRHAFFDALESTGCAVARTGWLAHHLIVEAPGKELLGILPCYLKSHSQGEYVFDYGWADAYERAGGRYYPKLQASVPFTPATGPRFLIPCAEQADRRRDMLAKAAVAVCDRVGASSFHITFLPHADWSGLEQATWLKRTDTQFHWNNSGFSTFDDFLGALSSRKRKNIRKERDTVARARLDIERLSGRDITEAHWDAFFRFYMDTGARKWGSPYLTRRFFSQIGETMGDDILLIMVKRAGRYIAGALNFIGGDTLYGRNWGAIEHHDCLHFEACYYQAIDYAIEHGLRHVEAGAQGPHKLARGYLPRTTYSAHHLADPRLAEAVRNYLTHERAAVAQDNRLLEQHSPFRRAERHDF